MPEQVCPHCDRPITENDIANYPKKLREKSLREEYKKSKIGRLYENIMATTIVLGVLAVFLTIVPLFLVDYEIVKPYANTLLYLETIFGAITIVWLIYGYSIKLPSLENDYVNEKLSKND